MKTKKLLTERQELLLKTLLKMPAVKNVLIITARELHEKMNKKGEPLTKNYIPSTIRLLVREGYLKTYESGYFKGIQGQRMKITLCKKK